MGKSTPKAPTAPDPTATAATQAKYNLQSGIQGAELNRINQSNTYGSSTYQQTGTNPDGTPIYSQTTTLSPTQQAIYSGQNQVSQALLGQANQDTGQLSQYGQQWNPNVTPLQTNVQGGNITGGYNTGGDITNQIQNAGNIQKGLDYSSLGALPDASQFQAQGQQVNDAVYNQATSRLDPQWQQQQNALSSTLAAKGITEGTAAYQRAMDEFQRQKTDAYNQANYSGIQAGAAEQAQLFGMGLQARQQGASEIASAGQFANTAQQQQYGQNASNAAFQNSAQQQANQQNAAAAQFANTAQQQGFTQGMQNADLNNQVNASQYQQQAYQRSLPLQELQQMQTMAGQAQQPTFQSVPQTQVAATDYSDLVQNQYNAQMQQYNQQLQAQSQGLGSIFGTIGTLGSAAMKYAPAIIAASDRRLKYDIKQVGQLPNGINTYSFKYIGSGVPQFGVMADEVFKVHPEAVGSQDGYLTVDYGKVL